MASFNEFAFQSRGWFGRDQSGEAVGDLGGAGRGRSAQHLLPSVRPPVMMMDLLVSALMLFAFQIGPSVQNAISTRELDIPSATWDRPSDPETLLALVPECCWSYRTLEGTPMTAAAAASIARQDGKTIVLLVSAEIRLQAYLDAEEPLRQGGARVGLAVENRE